MAMIVTCYFRSVWMATFVLEATEEMKHTCSIQSLFLFEHQKHIIACGGKLYKLNFIK